MQIVSEFAHRFSFIYIHLAYLEIYERFFCVQENRGMNPPPPPMEEATAVMIAAIDVGRGSFVNLLTRFGARYQGYVFRVDSPEFIIALTYVRCFGTEGRRMDGHEYSGSEQIYECIIFQGSEVMELQFLSLPPAQIGFVPFVPNYLAGYIAQSSPSIPLPVQYPSGNAPFAGPSNFAELQNPSLQPVGTGSANLYPPTIHSSPGQFATPESVLYLPFGSSVNTDVNTIEGSGSKPLQSWYAEGAEDQNLKVAAKTPKLGQDKQPWVSAALPSQSFQTAENDMKAAEASGSAPRPSLAAKDAKEHSTKSAAKTAFGLPPRPQPGRGQQERGAAVLEGSSGHGRGSVAFGRGR